MNLENEKDRLLQRDSEWARLASEGQDVERILSVLDGRCSRTAARSVLGCREGSTSRIRACQSSGPGVSDHVGFHRRTLFAGWGISRICLARTP